MPASTVLRLPRAVMLLAAAVLIVMTTAPAALAVDAPASGRDSAASCAEDHLEAVEHSEGEDAIAEGDVVEDEAEHGDDEAVVEDSRSLDGGEALAGEPGEGDAGEGDLPGEDRAGDECPAEATPPAGPTLRGILAEGFDGGALAVKAGSKITQELLAPRTSRARGKARSRGRAPRVLGRAVKVVRTSGPVVLRVQLNAAGRAYVTKGARLRLRTVVKPRAGRATATFRSITIR